MYISISVLARVVFFITERYVHSGVSVLARALFLIARQATRYALEPDGLLPKPETLSMRCAYL